MCIWRDGLRRERICLRCRMGLLWESANIYLTVNMVYTVKKEYGGEKMEIKEVEKLLSVSRSNIRFYEKAGLLAPERKDNNYRNYSQQDIATLKKILVLRKLGFSVEEIAAMQRGELAFSDAASDNIERLENEIESLTAALEMTKSLSEKDTTYSNMEEDHLWDEITKAETQKQKFVGICKDYASFEFSIWNRMCKYFFLHDFEDTKRKYGLQTALLVILIFCLIRGAGAVLIWKESFWEGFFYPFLIFLCASIIMLPLYILGKKSPRIASVIASVFLVLAAGFLILIGLLVLYGIFSLIFSLIC